MPPFRAPKIMFKGAPKGPVIPLDSHLHPSKRSQFTLVGVQIALKPKGFDRLHIQSPKPAETLRKFHLSTGNPQANSKTYPQEISIKQNISLAGSPDQMPTLIQRKGSQDPERDAKGLLGPRREREATTWTHQTPKTLAETDEFLRKFRMGRRWNGPSGPRRWCAIGSVGGIDPWYGFRFISRSDL